MGAQQNEPRQMNHHLARNPRAVGDETSTEQTIEFLQGCVAVYGGAVDGAGSGAC